MKKILIILLVAVFVASVIILSDSEDTEVVSESITGVMYKSPYCGCCGSWGSYMNNSGYDLEIVSKEDMNSVKEEYGVPHDLLSCHTAYIDGYVIEGHIPNEAISKLLEERPDIKGIGMAGMPSGSPGMPGVKEDFLIYEINHDGTKGELFMKI